MTDLATRNISLRLDLPNRGPVQALQDVSLAIKQGDIMSVLGPSGCGNTAIFNVAAGFLASASGKIELNGREVQGPDTERGIAFQKGALFDWMSVREIVSFGLRMKGQSQKNYGQNVDHLLDFVGLRDFKEKAIYELTGGMQQCMLPCY